MTEPTTDFIQVVDGALSAPFCQALIDAFEASPHRVAGQTGAGVDESKKISTDLYLNQHPEWRPALQEIQKATTLHLAEYFKRHHFALIAPMALTVQHPETGEPTALTHDNFDTVGAPRPWT
ncbi:hypothetical protein [Ideonella paludis]|uniref:hypothetical protein n=1 Tax=Ideonella paludis TaxID=1233411 RepID=UPI003630998D